MINSDAMGGAAWYAVRCKARQEMIARGHLENQGFEVYLPLVNTRIVHARKVRWEPRPFFSGYLFLRLSRQQQRWTTIRSTVGVLSPVRFGDYYPPVPDSVIEMLRSRQDENGYIVINSRPAVPFRSGERVCIHDGALKGLEGVFIEMRGSDRALVLLDWMQKQVRAETDTGLLSSVKS